MKRFVITPAAKVDLRSAKKYHEAQRPGLGKKFLDAVWARIQLLIQHPLSAPVVESNIHRAREDRFHFDIYYSVGEDEVVVIAVLHQRRHPDSWKKRL